MSSSTYGQSANMERIMRAQAFAHNQNENMLMDGMRTLEINPRHPFINKLYEEIDLGEGTEDPELSQTLKDALWNLMDTALLNGGYPVSEGKGFTNRMMRTIKAQLGVESVALLPEIEAPLEEDVPPEPEPKNDQERYKDDLQGVVDHLDSLGREEMGDEL